MITTEQAGALLNFSPDVPLDMNVLEEVVRMGHEGSPEQTKMASDVLTQFKAHELSWTRCHTMLKGAQDNRTKYFALQVLDEAVNQKWNVLPMEQREGMKAFIVEAAIEMSQSFESLVANQTLVSKLDTSLVYILKQEWPEKWPNFIPDIVSASKSSESLCQNNMIILKLLSEEVFDIKDQMTAVKTQRLKDSMCEQFGMVFDLCQFVLKHSETPSLLQATLGTLLNFLNWIPMGFIFETGLIQELVNTFLIVPQFRCVTMQCLTDIASIAEETTKPAQVEMFKGVMGKLQEMLPSQGPNAVDISKAYNAGTEDEQNFVQHLGLFLSTFLKNHGVLLEGIEGTEALGFGLEYLVMVSHVESNEIFKICLDYWTHITANLFHDNRGNMTAARRAMYGPVLDQVRLIMVMRMAKPEEVLVVEIDGEVVRETLKDTEGLEQYKQMNETLVYLTHLDCESTERIMVQKLARQMDGSEYSWGRLNTLCWAIGSISGAMSEDKEKKFLVTVIKDLLSLCEDRQGKNHKAIIASNIMYIVGQYPRFLRAHWKFLKTVVNKLFEFMHEKHEGVQDMACDTFIKIAQKCRRHFVTTQVMEQEPFINTIIREMNSTICDLEHHQIHTFYQAVGYMIHAQPDPDIRANLVNGLMDPPNQSWKAIIARAAENHAVLQDPQTIENLINILKTNVAACSSIGNDFIHQLHNIYIEVLTLYRTMSEFISSVFAGGVSAIQQPIVKSMRIVKKEILKLIGTWVPLTENPALVMESFIPPFLEAVLGDYLQSHEGARDAEVLGTMTKVVNALKGNISSQVKPIFEHVFQSTLDMINKDVTSYPEHRTTFYALLQSIATHCFDSVLLLSEDQLHAVILAVIWGFQHPMRPVAETSLRVMQEIVNKVSTTDASFSQPFYSKYFLMIMESIFSVMTDSLHYSELKDHTLILCKLFCLLEEGQVVSPLNAENPSQDNREFVQEYIGNKLHSAFPDLNIQQLQVITRGFFAFDQDPVQFKLHLRDFLVESREKSGEDLSSLYLVERQQELDKAHATKLMKQQAIPGMIAGAHDADMDSGVAISNFSVSNVMS
eukprot:m.57045 g.57045  ORF g.57045 m.57045 type:complete len:1070 (+) comp11077_c0_seq2:252-3461(+)